MPKPIKERLHYLEDDLPLPGPKGKILALDQSSSCSGFAYYENGKIVRHGHFKPAGKKFMQLVDSFEDQLNKWLDLLTPDLVLFESGGAHGVAKRYQTIVSLVVFEYIIQRVCWHRNQPLGAIQNEVLKAAVVDKQRIADLKAQRLRASLRPIKEDVQHAVCQRWGKEFEYFLSPDDMDALALLIAYSTNPSVVEMM